MNSAFQRSVAQACLDTTHSAYRDVPGDHVLHGRRRLLVVVLAPLALAGTLGAQSSFSGSVEGHVRDTRGSALAGVTVTASSEALMQGSRVTTTDVKGVYRFPSLPVGTYLLEAALDGYRPLRKEDLRVLLDRALGVDLTLEPIAIEETLTVTAEAPIVSVVGNRVAISFDATFIESQPLKRDYFNILRVAPGVNLDHRTGTVLAFGGTFGDQNAFTLDGVNIGSMAGGGNLVSPSIEWMQEVQIAGLGAGAEYGGYTGSLFNGVTKSGGNQTHGGIDIHYQPSGWVADNVPGDEEKLDYEFYDYVGSVGGRVVRDRLWYFLSAEYKSAATTRIGALASESSEVPRAFGKLTFGPRPSHLLALSVVADSGRVERAGVNGSVLPEASARFEQAGLTFAGNWEAQIDGANLAHLRLSGVDGRNDTLPYHGLDTPGRFDTATGISSVNQDIHYRNYRHRVAADVSWTLFAGGLLGGGDSHTFKFGGAYEQSRSSDEWLRNGGFTYFDDSSLCDSRDAYRADPSCGNYYVERGWGEYYEHPELEGITLFAQDSARFERWTVNLGLRYGDHRAGWAAGHGDPGVFSASFVDPRLGLVWDVRGDARTALKAHWGRYHDKVYAYLYDREASGRAAITDQDCFWNEQTRAFDRCTPPVARWARMDKSGLNYVDESLLTFEQQLGREVLLGVDLVDRRFRNFTAMVNANQDYELLSVTNPLTGETMPIWNLLTPPEWVLTTDVPGYRDFRSATLRLDKRYGHGWSARASVVYTDFEGNIQNNNGYAREFADPNGLYNGDGRMGYSFNEWEGKLSGTVDLRLGFQVSGQYTYLSGWYWTPFGRIVGLDYNWQVGRDILLQPRGTNRMPSRQLLDLRLAWTGRPPGKVHLTVAAEVFNVFNEDTVLNVSNLWGFYRISRGAWAQPRNYDTAIQIERPREFRASLRLTF